MNSGRGSPLEPAPVGRELFQHEDEHGRCCVPEAFGRPIDRQRDEVSATARATNGQNRWFCFFRGDAGPMAVAVESVAGVLETDTFVRLPWSPPGVVGMCSYHGEVVPVVVLDLPENHGRDGHKKGLESDAAPDHIPAKPGIDCAARCVVLVLKTAHGAWGIRIEAEKTFMGHETPEYITTPRVSDGSVVIGSVGLAGTCYRILDAEATWRGLRSGIAGWSGLASEPSSPASPPSEAETVRAGPGRAGEFSEA
jgi:chemotaxis signal transduction protein